MGVFQLPRGEVRIWSTQRRGPARLAQETQYYFGQSIQSSVGLSMIDRMTLTARINELTSIIGAPDSLLPQIGVKNDLARPYIELDRDLFYYIVREKGEIL